MGKIIGIDPGNEQSAVIIWDDKVISKGIEPNIKILPLLKRVESHEYTLVVEMIASYGMSVGKTVFETCVWIGRFIEAWENRDYGFKSALIYRKDEKMNLCGSMKAKDSNIRQALIDRFGPPGTKKAPNPIYNDSEIKMAKDLWAALAVCVTYQDMHK
jgi:hypothetical protein